MPKDEMSAAVAMPTDEPLDKRSVRERVYGAMKDMILTGQLRPGERLSENRLAGLLGVSRTPLREALMRLDEEGLVTGERNFGYTVRSLDVRAVCDLLVVREALDACAAEIAAVAASADDIRAITGVVDEIRALREGTSRRPTIVAKELELGLYIHELIVGATGNDALVRLTNQVYQQLRLALWLEFAWVDGGDESLAEHAAVADAIAARDAPAARLAAAKHVRGIIENMAEVERIVAQRSVRSPRPRSA